LPGDAMRVARTIMGVFYIVAGVAHFLNTRRYASIMPDYLPAHHELVLISGVAEIAGGLGVFIPQTRRAAAWGLIILLIVMMPANIWMVQYPERYSDIPQWILWVRLPLQLPLIWWAWLYSRTDRISQSSLQ